jgi:BirA family biotin operon repressor/biotin-[acetyl-CoA-carboxylase] ligase
VPEPDRISEVGRWRVLHFAELDSTNRYLLAAAADGARDGLVAVADHQTAGRGRLDRRWEAPPGSSLLVSVLLRLPVGGDGFRLVMAASVALAEAVETTAGIAAGLKWPNDVVVGDRKLAGLLAERVDDALVVGAGCNVNWDAFGPELVETATACNLESGRPVDRDALLEAYLAGLAARLGAPARVLDAYVARLGTVGRRVRIERGGGAVLEGVATDLDPSGALLVRDASGVLHTVTVGDVVHLRPA